MVPDEYLDALLAIPRVGSGEVSPDGRWVAWTWYGAGEGADVFVARTDSSSAPIRLTATDQETVFTSWALDSRAVLVGQDQGGDERAVLYRVSLDSPGELCMLTEGFPPYFIHGGEITPGDRFLLYGMNYDVEEGMEIEPTWIYRHDLASGERIPLARPMKAAFTRPDLNHAGTHVLYERQDLNPAGRQVWLVDVEGREDQEILNVGADRKVTASWFPDSHHILFLAETNTHRQVGMLDVETGELRLLIDNPERNIEDASAPRGTERPTVVVVETRDAKTRASLLDVESGVETQLPEVGGTLLPIRPVEGGDWVALFYSSTQPADIVRFRLDGTITASLTRIWDLTQFQPADFVPAENLHWESVDGLAIQGWLYRTRQPDRGTVVLVHGGPTAHSEDTFSPQVQFYLSQGFNVLVPNYRGSTGFGLPYQESIKEDGWGGREQDDIRVGIEALIERGVAQPGKIGITGTSYGGYSCWCAITSWPHSVLAAAAPICGMTDLVVDYETTRPDLRPYSEEMMGGSPEQVPERYQQRSPIHFVDRIKGKLLIVQGLRDPNVTPENVRAVREALDVATVPYEALVFQDEGHGIIRSPNQKILYRRLAEFFGNAFSRS